MLSFSFSFFFFSAHVKRFHEVAGDAAKLAELKRLKTLCFCSHIFFFVVVVVLEHLFFRVIPCLSILHSSSE